MWLHYIHMDQAAEEWGRGGSLGRRQQRRHRCPLSLQHGTGSEGWASRQIAWKAMLGRLDLGWKLQTLAPMGQAGIFGKE